MPRGEAKKKIPFWFCNLLRIKFNRSTGASGWDPNTTPWDRHEGAMWLKHSAHFGGAPSLESQAALLEFTFCLYHLQAVQSGVSSFVVARCSGKQPHSEG